ncbi:aryl-alcohol dehydrogenase-like predicted oxidoreductase [Kaistia hirudinis]|uniref:Aryl-alcohol dehydrogenase-like predicted oxidoreductase n=1 Tax=Kaistia hirudinis TaxID=1293440 RepID=A0A840APS4_9HYPH|nr:aldo/keto reductase [Kaistia hirudinis]MBB3931632.1 aryl-alcohol dehydrogenase-like predicted oxidoreductase [Kaistia hirudinis]
MQKRPLGRSGMTIAPLVFGGNVFGWTADEATSFRLLDAFVDHGFDAIDTADVYSSWVPGNKGGESESVIGNWLKARPGVREKVKIFTKVGSDLGQPGKKGLSERWILQAADESLARLGIETIDLYFSHWPDAAVSQEETLGAYAKLIAAGKVRAVGVSNVDANQLGEALRISAEKGLPRYEVLQPEYNLYARSTFEGALQQLCVAEDIGVVTYFSLASGFLTGKYRSEADFGKSPRGGGMGDYFNDRGRAVLAALDAVAASHNATPAAVALAWLMAQPGVTAPIASATRLDQFESLARAAELVLSPEDLARLDQSGR